MSKKKEPPDYPGDEAIKKRLGEVMRELRLEKRLSIEDLDAFIDKRMQEDTHPRLARAFSLVIRELRERKKMSRMELSEASGLPLRLINQIERAKAHNLTLIQAVRIAMALEHDVTDLVEQAFKVEERLKAN
jgi:DNA-binding Xre family transcriptional regulator